MNNTVTFMEYFFTSHANANLSVIYVNYITCCAISVAMPKLPRKHVPTLRVTTVNKSNIRQRRNNVITSNRNNVITMNRNNASIQKPQTHPSKLCHIETTVSSKINSDKRDKLISMKSAFPNSIPRVINDTYQELQGTQSYMIRLRSFVQNDPKSQVPVMYGISADSADSGISAITDQIHQKGSIHLLDADPYLGETINGHRIIGSYCTKQLIRQATQCNTITYPLWKMELNDNQTIVNSCMSGLGVIFEGSLSTLYKPQSFLGIPNQDQLVSLCELLLLRRSECVGPVIFMGLGHCMVFEALKNIILRTICCILEHLQDNNALIATCKLIQQEAVRRQFTTCCSVQSPRTKHSNRISDPNILTQCYLTKPQNKNDKDISCDKLKFPKYDAPSSEIQLPRFSKHHIPSESIVEFCTWSLHCLQHSIQKHHGIISRNQKTQWILEIPTSIKLAAIFDKNQPGMFIIEYSDALQPELKFYSFTCIGHLTVCTVENWKNKFIGHLWFCYMLMQTYRR